MIAAALPASMTSLTAPSGSEKARFSTSALTPTSGNAPPRVIRALEPTERSAASAAVHEVLGGLERGGGLGGALSSQRQTPCAG